ncbi:Cys-tRNA(Pro) deacylase [Dehalobacterium formicoaceticum]|uniref:Cys-tRNA(Pro) deacylase n=1 Tax=Dehalobacterium formicoaceticum TaxID=51515 RepID=UPI0031F6F1A9
MAQAKTNAMRILDQNGIPYQGMSYDSRDGKVDGISVAQKIGRDPKMVYKTLVTEGHSKNIYVFIIPVAGELDLKKAAAAAGEKKIEMIPVKDIQKLTGYIRGGCSPIGMKKSYPTFLAREAMDLGEIIVSGGKIGFQIQLPVAELQKATGAAMSELLK